jgi:hypothetical protein
MTQNTSAHREMPADLSAELKLKRKRLKRRSHAITTPSAFGSVACASFPGAILSQALQVDKLGNVG